MIAIIGGSGLSRLPEIQFHHRQIVRTPYGLPSSTLLLGTVGQIEVVFLARHGFAHTIAPHQINYRANIWALHHIGASAIVSAAAVYSLNEQLQPGQLVLPADILDYTHSREQTFYEGEHQQVLHTAFDTPYDAALKQLVIQTAQATHTAVSTEAVYACLQGPRFPSKAEVKRYRQDGADVFGMTGMPEVILAKELNLPYVHLCGVIGWAAGLTDTCTTCTVSPTDVSAYQAMDQIKTLLSHLSHTL